MKDRYIALMEYFQSALLNESRYYLCFRNNNDTKKELWLYINTINDEFSFFQSINNGKIYQINDIDLLLNDHELALSDLIPQLEHIILIHLTSLSTIRDSIIKLFGEEHVLHIENANEEFKKNFITIVSNLTKNPNNLKIVD